MLAKTRTIKTLGAVTGLLASAGCEVTPEPFADNQPIHRAQADLAAIRSGEFVPTKPITLHEAMARAVSLNLKRRVTYIERRIAECLTSAPMEQTSGIS